MEPLVPLATRIICVNSHPSYPWITLAGVVVAVLGIGAALWNTGRTIKSAAAGAEKSNRNSLEIAKKRATLDLILAEQTHAVIITKREEFLRLRDGDRPLVDWAHDIQAEEARHISATINRYELIAIGIKNDILSEPIYKSYLKSTVIKDWRQTEPFIAELRRTTGIKALYENFEAMAKRFQGN